MVSAIRVFMLVVFFYDGYILFPLNLSVSMVSGFNFWLLNSDDLF